MSQKESKMTIEDIKAQFLEIPPNNNSNGESKELVTKLIKNNIKLCTFAELFQQRSTETTVNNQNDSKINQLKNSKIAVDVLNKLYKQNAAETSELEDKLTEMKLKLKEKRFFDNNRGFYVDFRERIFPMLMQDADKKEALIDIMRKGSTNEITENDLKKVTLELEKIRKQNEILKKTEEEIIEIRRQNEVIEANSCRAQVRISEMESDLRSFDEKSLTNQITELQERIKAAKEAKLKKKQQKCEDDFKDPNDFPTLLDFLDKSKRYKQKKKRKLASPSRPSSKRRKNKTGSYSQHDNNNAKAGSSPKQNRQLRSSSSKNYDHDKARVMQSYGLKANNSANLSQQSSNGQGNMLQRTFASRDLSNSPRPKLQRQKSFNQMKPSTSSAGMSRNSQQDQKGLNHDQKSQSREAPQNYDDYETDEDGHLLLQHFPSRPLFPEDSPKKTSTAKQPLADGKSQKSQKIQKGAKHVNKPQSRDQPQNYDDYETDEDGHLLLQHFPSRPLFPEDSQSKTSPKNVPALKDNNKKPEKPAEPLETTSNDAVESMETESSLDQVSVTKQPSADRNLRSRKNKKKNKSSPKKAEKNNKKENDHKKVKSPKKSRGRKKDNKIIENEMIVDENNILAVDENGKENLMVVDDNNAITSGDNVDKSMAVDEIPITEGSVGTETAQINAMEVDQIVQNQEIDTNITKTLSNEFEVNMEQESPENNTSNIEMFDVSVENNDQNKTGTEGQAQLSTSFERLFCSSPNSSGNLEFNQSFGFDFDNSREGGTDTDGNKDDFFNFDSGNDDNDYFFGDNTFKSNEGKADDFF